MLCHFVSVFKTKEIYLALFGCKTYHNFLKYVKKLKINLQNQRTVVCFYFLPTHTPKLIFFFLNELINGNSVVAREHLLKINGNATEVSNSCCHPDIAIELNDEAINDKM